jgi:hypothetical protein
MVNSWAPFIPLLLFPVIGGLVFWAAVVQKRRATANLQKWAAQLGLKFIPADGWTGSGRVTGCRRGKQIDFFNYTTGSGKSRQTWCAVTARPAVASELTFTLQKRSFLTKIEKLFGIHEITVGDAAFDQAWFVQTNQPEFLRAALIPELRVKLMAARSAGAVGKFTLKDGEVKYAEIGTFSAAKRMDRLAGLTDVVCDLADVAEVAADGPGQR